MRKPIVGVITLVYLLAWLFAVLPVTKLFLPFPLNVTLGFNLVAGGLTTIGLIFLLTRHPNASKQSKDDQAIKDEITKGHRDQFLESEIPQSSSVKSDTVAPSHPLASSNTEARIPVILTRRYRGSIAIQDLELIDERVEESKW